MTHALALPAGFAHPGLQSARWYGSLPKTSQNLNPVVDQVTFIPVLIPKPCIITDLALQIVTSATVSQLARLALYGDQNAQPIGLPLSEGVSTIDLTQVPGAYSVALQANIPVAAGVAWIALWVNASGGSAAVLRGGTTVATNSWLIGGVSANGPTHVSSGSSAGYSKAAAFGASFPAATGLAGQNLDFTLGYKVL